MTNTNATPFRNGKATDSAETLESEQWLPQPVEKLFAFFCNPHNLEAITVSALDQAQFPACFGDSLFRAHEYAAAATVAEFMKGQYGFTNDDNGLELTYLPALTA